MLASPDNLFCFIFEKRVERSLAACKAVYDRSIRERFD